MNFDIEVSLFLQALQNKRKLVDKYDKSYGCLKSIEAKKWKTTEHLFDMLPLDPLHSISLYLFEKYDMN